MCNTQWDVYSTYHSKPEFIRADPCSIKKRLPWFVAIRAVFWWKWRLHDEKDNTSFSLSIFSKWKSDQVERSLVGNQWTKLAEIWPTDCQIVILKTIVRILISFFRFLSNSIFSTGNSNDLLSLTSSTQLSQKNKGTRQKSESRLSSQTCHEANAILIDFFRLFLADLDLNLQRHVYFCKKLVNSETR